MNNAKAKFILRSYRSSGADAVDPAFREALEQAERDPALKAWIQTERETDEIIRAKLNAVLIPHSLRDDILAIPPGTNSPRFWRRGTRWLAIAAALVVLISGVLTFMPVRQPDLAFEAFPQMAASFLARPFQLQYTASTLDEAKAWLAARHGTSNAAISDALHAAAGEIGCHPIDWRGTDVYLLCFFQEEGKAVHYFIMDVEALPNAPKTDAPLWVRHGKYMTATWADDRHAYVLAGEMDMATLQALL